ncbi:unnamed protein product [Arabis nemorensis]|uniref:Uncharacterized protein n=1 Tax=Arabis nemorensis TaxID=586526 RepID=A0A565AYE7_9BRAS|nr:unnamed protein product [Arabis nemorensis]
MNRLFGKKLLIRFNGTTCLIAIGPFHKQREREQLRRRRRRVSVCLCKCKGSPITTSEAFEDGQTRPVSPLFNRDLLWFVENNSEEGIEEGNDGVSVTDEGTRLPTNNYGGNDLAGQEKEEIEIWVSQLT